MEWSERVAGFDAGKIAFGAIFAVANRLQRVLDAVMPGLTAKQWWLLVVLSAFDQPPTLSELADAADTSHQNVRQILRKLEAGGFVTVTRDAHDGRTSRVNATAKVGQWGAATDIQARQFMEAMYADVSSHDVESLGRSLIRIHTALGRLTPMPVPINPSTKGAL